MKFLVTFLAAMLIFATVDAAKIDIYKTAIQNKTFTLKYKVHKFQARSINKNSEINVYRGAIYDQSQFGKSSADTGGVVVFNKDDSYVENSYDAYQIIKSDNQLFETVNPGGNVLLRKNGEIFSYSFEVKNGKRKYSTGWNLMNLRGNKIKATTEEKLYKNQNPYQVMFYEYNYGNPTLYQALAAVLPADRVIAGVNTPNFNFIGAGNLTNGYSYEDFYGEKNNFHSAIRYYFKDDKLVEIAMFHYVKDEHGIRNYEKAVIVIEEFSTTPNESYLQLPASLKDVTKR